MVSGLWQLCSVFVLNERVASSPASGSTPITLQPGARCEAATAQPEISPPPLHSFTVCEVKPGLRGAWPASHSAAAATSEYRTARGRSGAFIEAEWRDSARILRRRNISGAIRPECQPDQRIISLRGGTQHS